MSTSSGSERCPMAVGLTFQSHELSVALSDGRTITAPLEWFPRLRDASETQRSEWRLIGGGVGIHWDELDEDISVEGLLAGESGHLRRSSA